MRLHGPPISLVDRFKSCYVPVDTDIWKAFSRIPPIIPTPNPHSIMHTRLRLLLVPLVAVLLMGMATGTSSAPPPDGEQALTEVGLVQQLFFLNKMNPNIERVGVIWKKGTANQDSKLESAKRAVASIGGKLYVGYVEDRSEVAEQFRRLTSEHDVQAIWIVENDGIVDASTPREYLIKNTIEKGVPLLAPTTDWVDAGAPVTIAKSGGKAQIVLNEAAANATGLQVPENLQPRTKLIAAAN